MKKISLWLGFTFLCFLIQTCREEEQGAHVANVQFSLNPSSAGDAGGRMLSNLSEGSVVLISIINQNGDPVHSLKELTLLKFGNQFISNPLPLSPGQYSITDFFVGNADHEVLYAMPKAGSSLAAYVDDALPMTFTVAENEIADVGVEVISTNTHDAGEFGYETFPMEISTSEAFNLSVYAPEENGTVNLTDIQGYILLGADTIQNMNLPASINSIVFDTTPDEAYTLVLIKDSFKKYSRTFRVNDLNEELNGNPLSIILEPAFTVVVDPLELEDGYRFSFDISNENPTDLGKVSIDWGDGTVEEIDVPHECCQEQIHVYPSAGKRFVSVSGDLEAIKILSIHYDNPLVSISLRQLKELKMVSIVETATPETIDLSYNVKLESAAFGLTWIKSLNVSHNIYLKQLFLVYMTDFSGPSMVQIIHDLHQHAVDHHLTEGYLTIVDLGGQQIGPLTPEAIDKLHDLRDNYHWTIEP